MLSYTTHMTAYLLKLTTNFCMVDLGFMGSFWAYQGRPAIELAGSEKHSTSHKVGYARYIYNVPQDDAAPVLCINCDENRALHSVLLHAFQHEKSFLRFLSFRRPLDIL